ncbi:MAG TPA: porin [Polyangiaceae bacterium]|nr:porin [Polyangiaceae bacterium]
MRRFGMSSVRWAAAAVVAVLAIPGRARADVTLVQNPKWTFYTRGLIAAHYQLVKGDADPNFYNSLPSAGGQILDEKTASDVRDNKLTLSNIRSGFIGTQMGFGLIHPLSESVKVEAFSSINMAGINSNRGQELQKAVDYREAWADVQTPYGSVKFGRMFGIFGEGSAEVMVMAWKYGVGHPCVINAATISCGSSGAGPLYAGFDGAIRYTTPRIVGLQAAVAVVDPSVSSPVKMSPTPRFDGEVSYDRWFRQLHVRLIGQGLYEKISQSTAPVGIVPGTIRSDTVWGGMGTGIVGIGPVALGGGGWMGAGIGERVPLESRDASNPLFMDKSGRLRKFRGFYGNLQGNFMDNYLTVGGGIMFVQPSSLDKSATASNDVLDHQSEYHVTYQHHFDAIILNAEYMHWETKWHFGEKQKLNFMGVGANFEW